MQSRRRRPESGTHREGCSPVFVIELRFSVVRAHWNTTQDTILPLRGLSLQNSGGPVTLTASVADVVLVGVRSSGPSLGRLPSGIAVIAGSAPNVASGLVLTTAAGAATLGGVAPSLHSGFSLLGHLIQRWSGIQPLSGRGWCDRDLQGSKVLNAGRIWIAP